MPINYRNDAKGKIFQICGSVRFNNYIFCLQKPNDTRIRPPHFIFQFEILVVYEQLNAGYCNDSFDRLTFLYSVLVPLFVPDGGFPIAAQ